MTIDPPPPAAHGGTRGIILALVVLLAIGGAATALVYNYTARNDGRAGAAVLFQIDRGDPILPSSRGEFVRDEFEDYRQSQTAMVVSRRVLDSALNDSEVKQTQLIREADPDAITWVETNLRVTSTRSSSFIRVELDGENIAELLIVLNAVASAYQELSSERDKAQSVRRLSELEKASKECRSEFEHARRESTIKSELTSGRSNGLLHIRTEAEFAEEIRLARNELRRVRFERALLEANLQSSDELRWESRIAAVGGAVMVGFAGEQPSERRRTRILKELSIREQLWVNEMKEFKEIQAMRSRYADELQELKRKIDLKTDLLMRLEDEIERCNLDMRSGPRVSVVDEPHVRPRRP
jgi:hypothetical protein